MKIEWREFGGEWRAVIGRGVVASIEQVGDKYYGSVLGGVVRKSESIEAAKYVAEQEIRKWFREALGEPVGYVDLSDLHRGIVVTPGMKATTALYTLGGDDE